MSTKRRVKKVPNCSRCRLWYLSGIRSSNRRRSVRVRDLCTQYFLDLPHVMAYFYIHLYRSDHSFNSPVVGCWRSLVNVGWSHAEIWKRFLFRIEYNFGYSSSFNNGTHCRFTRSSVHQRCLLPWSLPQEVYYTNVKKVIECVVFAFVTSSCFFAVVAARNS